MELEHHQNIGCAVAFRLPKEHHSFLSPVTITPGLTVAFLADGGTRGYREDAVSVGFRREDVIAGIELIATIDEQTGRLLVSDPTTYREFSADAANPGPHGIETPTHDFCFLWGRNSMDISWRLDLIRRVDEFMKN